MNKKAKWYPTITGEWLRLPSGNSTQNVTYFARAWREFAAPLANILDMHATGYAPGVLYLSNDNTRASYTLSLPTWVIKKINAALKGT